MRVFYLRWRWALYVRFDTHHGGMISHQISMALKCLGATWLLACSCEGSSSCAVGHSKLVDNWREVQPVGSDRTVFRSAAAAASCAETCDNTDDHGGSTSYVSTTCPVDAAVTITQRTLDTTTNIHWT